MKDLFPAEAAAAAQQGAESRRKAPPRKRKKAAPPPVEPVVAGETPMPDSRTWDKRIYGIQRPASPIPQYLIDDWGLLKAQEWAKKALPLKRPLKRFDFTPEGQLKILREDRGYSDEEIRAEFPELADYLEA